MFFILKGILNDCTIFCIVKFVSVEPAATIVDNSIFINFI